MIHQYFIAFVMTLCTKWKEYKSQDPLITKSNCWHETLMNVSKPQRLKRFDVGLSWNWKYYVPSKLELRLLVSFDFSSSKRAGECFQRKDERGGSLWHVLFVGSWMAKGRQFWWSLCKKKADKNWCYSCCQSHYCKFSCFPSGVDRSITFASISSSQFPLSSLIIS